MSDITPDIQDEENDMIIIKSNENLQCLQKETYRFRGQLYIYKKTLYFNLSYFTGKKCFPVLGKC